MIINEADEVAFGLGLSRKIRKYILLFILFVLLISFFYLSFSYVRYNYFLDDFDFDAKVEDVVFDEERGSINLVLLGGANLEYFDRVKFIFDTEYGDMFYETDEGVGVISSVSGSSFWDFVFLKELNSSYNYDIGLEELGEGISFEDVKSVLVEFE